TAMPQPDGTIKAVEVHVFAEPLRGIGEGHYPWDLMPNSSMTNAAVTQQVKKADGNTLMLKYKDGEKTIVVPSDATVVNLIPGDRDDLKPGAKIFIPRWEKRAGGTWEATVAVVGREGITPPMWTNEARLTEGRLPKGAIAFLSALPEAVGILAAHARSAECSP